MGVLPIHPNVPRGTPRRNSETDGANDPFARLSECSTWNIRRSQPLIANLILQSFLHPPQDEAFCPGTKKASVRSPR